MYVAQESLARLIQRHARAVRVGEVQHDRVQQTEAAVRQVVLNRAVLVDAVDVDRIDRVIFVHREIAGLAVDLSGSRVDDAHARRRARTLVEKTKLRGAVQRPVPLREAHAVRMADLSGEVENDIGPAERFREPRGLVDVLQDQPDLAGGRFDVAPVGAAARDLGVYHRDSGPKFQEPERQVAPNESQAARYDSPFVPETQSHLCRLCHPAAAQ